MVLDSTDSEVHEVEGLQISIILFITGDIKSPSPLEVTPWISGFSGFQKSKTALIPIRIDHSALM